MPTLFTPPARSAVPPVLPWRAGEHPLASRLFRHYRSRPEGINVYLLSDGTITEDDPDGTLVVWSKGDRTGESVNAKWVATAWLGGHDNYELTDAQASLLTANGYTVVDNTPPTPTPPVASSLSPSSGVAGTVVTILGSNLAEVSTVIVGGSTVAFTILSRLAITFTMPVGGAGTYPVQATNAYGTSDALNFTLSVVVPGANPDITNVTPTSGPAGTVLTISGSGFTNATSVELTGGHHHLDYSVVTDSQITATVSTLDVADGTVFDVHVETAIGEDNFTGFTYTISAPGDAHPGSDILAEDGSFILAEDGTSTIQAES